VSLSLVVGILVAGLNHPFFLSAAKAQTDSEPVDYPVSIFIGNSIPVSQGEVVGSLISAQGVMIDGVTTDFLFSDKITILDSAIISDSPISLDGVGISGQVVPKTDVAIIGTGDDTTPYGVGISGQVAPQYNIVVSGDSGVQVTGGQLLGDNISVVDGVIQGENLRLVGATVSGANLCVENVAVTVPGS
jgi:hypothetical protein